MDDASDVEVNAPDEIANELENTHLSEQVVYVCIALIAVSVPYVLALYRITVCVHGVDYCICVHVNEYICGCEWLYMCSGAIL